MKHANVLVMILFSIIFLNANVCNADDISSISKLELYEENTDSKPEMDSLKIYVIFGDKHAKRINPLDGITMDYTCKIYSYEGGKKGNKINEDRGKLISERGFTSFVIKMPRIAEKKRVLADVTVKLPDGRTVQGKRSDTFDPEKY